MVCSTTLTMVGMATSTWEPMGKESWFKHTSFCRDQPTHTLLHRNYKCYYKIITTVYLSMSCGFVVTTSTLPHIELVLTIHAVSLPDIHDMQKKSKAKFVTATKWSHITGKPGHLCTKHTLCAGAMQSSIEHGQGARRRTDCMYSHCRCGHPKSHQYC